MTKTIYSFLLVTVLAGLLMTLSIMVARHGYPYGAIGMKRLDSVIAPASFLPLAAMYFFSIALLMILPLRAAGFVFLHGSEPLYWTVLMLFAIILGGLVARAAFGQISILWTLWNWQFLFVAAVFAVHSALNILRANVLLRSSSLVVLLIATLACLFWSFSI